MSGPGHHTVLPIKPCEGAWHCVAAASSHFPPFLWQKEWSLLSSRLARLQCTALPPPFLLRGVKSSPNSCSLRISPAPDCKGLSTLSLQGPSISPAPGPPPCPVSSQSLAHFEGHSRCPSSVVSVVFSFVREPSPSPSCPILSRATTLNLVKRFFLLWQKG